MPDLDEDENWPQRLPGGEQQRVALARALLAKPDWLFAKRSVEPDPASEAQLYRTLKQRLPATTIVSIAHRPTVAQFHDHRLVFRREEGKPGQLVRAEPAPASARRHAAAVETLALIETARIVASSVDAGGRIHRPRIAATCSP